MSKDRFVLAANASGFWVYLTFVALIGNEKSTWLFQFISARPDSAQSQLRSHYSKARTSDSHEIIDEYRSVKLSKVLFRESDSLLILFAHWFQIGKGNQF